MPLLLLVSFIWAFSFGLLAQLKGIDSAFIAATRLGLAMLVFLPFLRVRKIGLGAILAFTGIGVVQFGVMYLAYNESFHYLKSHEIALFTLTTPILVTLVADALDRTMHWRALLAAALSVLGAGCVAFKQAPSAAWTGIALVQLSNLAFATGQVLYRRMRLAPKYAALRDRDVFGLLYAGAFIVTLVVLLQEDATINLNGTQLLVLGYLGVIASGVGFFLWNRGAMQVNPGVLAAMNNAKIPLAVACSLLIFREHADVPRLLIGGAVMAGAVWVAGGEAS
jgi:drug/metabolite transporter (DMT)-like permease